MPKGADYLNRGPVRVDGLTEAKATLAALPDAFHEVAIETIGTGMGIIEDEAIKRVPVDEGDLQDSIGTNIRADGLQGATGSGLHYAKFVEFGTSNAPAQPFLYPAFKRGARYIRKEIREWAKEAGMRARFKTKRSKRRAKKA